MIKVLICGANGFIGYNAVKYFANIYGGSNITGTLFNTNDKPAVDGVNYKYVDLRLEKDVQELFRNGQFDIVIQAAAIATGSKDIVERPYIHVADNVVMNAWIFREAAFNKVKHVIFPSCTAMYQSSELPQTENQWDASDEIYPAYFGIGNMKVFTEKMCDFYSRISDTKFTAIRHSNVFGPYDKFDLDKCHLIPALINKVYHADKTLQLWSAEAKRDILYIDDLMDFIHKCINNQQKEYVIFNCGQGRAFSVREYAELISAVASKDLSFRFDDSKPNIPTTVILNCDKARYVLGWKPEIWITDGIRRTYEWYSNQFILEEKEATHFAHPEET